MRWDEKCNSTNEKVRNKRDYIIAEFFNCTKNLTKKILVSLKLSFFPRFTSFNFYFRLLGEKNFFFFFFTRIEKKSCFFSFLLKPDVCQVSRHNFMERFPNRVHTTRDEYLLSEHWIFWAYFSLSHMKSISRKLSIFLREVFFFFSLRQSKWKRENRTRERNKTRL